MKTPEAYPLGYVEDAFKARTLLAGFFSILRNTHPFARSVRRML
jgi:hypothetical protein